jgi:hypothetical protein
LTDVLDIVRRFGFATANWVPFILQTEKGQMIFHQVAHFFRLKDLQVFVTED